MKKGLLLGGAITIGGIIIAFVFLLRGCLAQYDERSVRAPLLYFEKDGRSLTLSLVQFDKTVSYERSGGFVRKSVKTSYYLQTNDPETGARIDEKKIADQSSLRQFPVEMIASAGGYAWVFAGGLKRFDPFTLALVADIKAIEKLNPAAKGKFPLERRFYQFDDVDNSFVITLTDGSVFRLNTTTLLLSPSADTEENNSSSLATIGLRQQLRQNSIRRDSLMENKLRNPSRLLAAREITVTEYQAMIREFNAERALVQQAADSLQELLRVTESTDRHLQETRRAAANIKSKTSLHFSQIKINADTSGGVWRGLYTVSEFDKLPERIYLQSAHQESARRQFYQAPVKADRNREYMLAKEESKTATEVFLNGGFLLDKQTGYAMRLGNNRDLLIVHKETVGNAGLILLTRIDRDGKVLWTINSHLRDWADWLVTGDRILVLGRDNEELSGDEQNILHSIDLRTGKSSRYDYFEDKVIK